MSTTPKFLDGPTICCCDGCDWRGAAEELDDIDRLHERLDAGGVVPAGECPACGALAYIDKDQTPPVELAYYDVTFQRSSWEEVCIRVKASKPYEAEMLARGEVHDHTWTRKGAEDEICLLSIRRDS